LTIEKYPATRIFLFARERARKSAKEKKNNLIFVLFFIFAAFRALSRADFLNLNNHQLRLIID
jgi:hypothetical protein